MIPRLRSRCVLGLLLAVLAADASASWRGAAGVRSSLILTDNLFLTTDDTESGGVIQVRPYFSASRAGNRVNASINYGPSVLFYPQNSELNDVRHTLSARMSSELIERYFFLDVRANANQALLNPRVNSDFDAIGNPDAFTQQASISITPRINIPVLDGRFATVRIEPGVGFDFTESTADGDGGLSTPTRDTRVTVNSGPMFTTVPWSVTWRRQLFDADEDRGFGEVSGRVGYIFSPRYRLDLILGYDQGRDAFRAADGETSGLRWETIFRWTPNRRARFQFGYGERYFGETYRFDGQYRHKRWVFRSRYNVTVQSATSELAQQEVVPLRDLFGEPIRDPFDTDQVLTATVITPVIVNDTFLRDRFELQSLYQKGRNTASVRWFVTRREYDQADLDTRDNQMQLRYSRRMSNRLTASAVVNFWDHSEENDDGFDFFQDAVDLVLSYRLGPRANLGARIGRLSRDAEAAGGDFSEHRASLDFSLRF